jgi:regulator of protease activity HflC (stomatin/prohibitin superfamily)
MLFASGVFLIISIWIISRVFIVVPYQQAFIQERLGNFKRTLEAGFHLLVPIIDRVAYRHTLKEEVIDVPPQVCITRDNVQVEVDGILYIRVMDAKKASYGINNYRYASIQLAQTSMRSEVGKLDLDHTFSEREKINDAVIKSIDLASEPWGVKVTRYEIKNIIPTENVLHTMEMQMKAERDKRAEIAHSEGERSAVINRSEGDKQQSINVSEGEKQKRINESTGAAKAIELLAEATAEGIHQVAAAINQPGGDDAVNLRIAEEFIKRFGAIIEKAPTAIVPLDIGKIDGVFRGVSQVMQNVSGGKGNA